jgi:hypothetical protein
VGRANPASIAAKVARTVLPPGLLQNFIIDSRRKHKSGAPPTARRLV